MYDGDILNGVFDAGTVKRANEIAVGLPNPSKVPKSSPNLPASSCKTGSRLKDEPGSVRHLLRGGRLGLVVRVEAHEAGGLHGPLAVHLGVPSADFVRRWYAL